MLETSILEGLRSMGRLVLHREASVFSFPLRYPPCAVHASIAEGHEGLVVVANNAQCVTREVRCKSPCGRDHVSDVHLVRQVRLEELLVLQGLGRSLTRGVCAPPEHCGPRGKAKREWARS